MSFTYRWVCFIYKMKFSKSEFSFSVILNDQKIVANPLPGNGMRWPRIM